MMITINADLHIHSRFSISTSKFMTFKKLAEEAPKKGVHVVGTGDCLHSEWLNELKELERVDEGTFELNGTRFILTVEVQAKGRVHHLILFPSLSSVEEFRELIQSKSKNLTTDGRPSVTVPGDELAQLARDVDALYGPCHAFTPWTGIYGYFDSLEACYGDNSKHVSFIELGLSADSSYADRISELKNLTFLTNSDAHSPYPLRLAREFNQFKVEDITYNEVKKAILRLGGRKCVLNVGLPPAIGKYNQSACSRCFVKYSLIESQNANWRCSCGGRIKKGVIDRVLELSDNSTPNPPDHRPKYLYLIPLAEIISKVLDHSSTTTSAVKNTWNTLISKYSNEISVLLDSNIDELEKITDSLLADAIRNFRENKIILHPGGGGRYGQIELPKFN
jgi:uncharacterized protein (TIGR00375 family)